MPHKTNTIAQVISLALNDDIAWGDIVSGPPDLLRFIKNAVIKSVAPRVEEFVGWRPIETVPRDHVVDLWHRTAGRLTDCWWNDPEWAGAAIGLLDDDFTHWMPLPDDPKEPDQCET